MHGIKALLFDVDGTLLDTREFIFQATEHALSTYGYPVPERAAMARLVGKPIAEYYFILTGSPDTMRLQSAHREFQLANQHLSVLYPHTIETLATLRERGYIFAAVTTRSNKTSLKSLHLAGIDKFFATIVSAEDASEVKPHPEPVLKALAQLHEPAEQAVMIGDSDVDVEAGKKAGTKTIRATYGFHTERLYEMMPDFFINDISELTDIL